MPQKSCHSLKTAGFGASSTLVSLLPKVGKIILVGNEAEAHKLQGDDDEIHFKNRPFSERMLSIMKYGDSFVPK